MLHRDTVPEDVHVVHSWVVPTLADLTALPVVSTDIGRFALVTSPRAFHILVNDVGPVWVELGGGGGGGGGGSRILLTANTTYYVATSGNDSSGDGSSGAPWATLQKAFNYLMHSIDHQGYGVTIQLADGSYVGSGSPTELIGYTGALTILGNVGTPTNVVVSNIGAHALIFTNCRSVLIDGFRLSTTTSGNALSVRFGANVTIGRIDFGACASLHISIWGNAYVDVANNYTVSGNAISHIYVQENSYFRALSRTITHVGSPVFSGLYIYVFRQSMALFASSSISGTATANKRYEANLGGHIAVPSGNTSFFPGTAGGTTATGGQYTAT